MEYIKRYDKQNEIISIEYKTCIEVIINIIKKKLVLKDQCWERQPVLINRQNDLHFSVIYLSLETTCIERPCFYCQCLP